MAVRLADVRAAASAIEGAVLRTQCVPSQTLSEITGARIFVKFENHQYTASFKERGALNKLLTLTDKERKAGVIAMSAGNHAQGVAYHAHRLGIPATVVMPRHTPFSKVARTRVHGATVVLEGDGLDGAAKEANRLAADGGLAFVHPYNDDHIIAGQGTVGLEMLDAQPDLDCIVVPVGGGGLIGGIAVAAKGIKPGIEIIGVEAALFPAMQETLRGTALSPGGPTIAEGIAVKHPGGKTLPLVRDLVDDLVSVREDEIESAIVLYLEVEKSVSEGAGAAALGAVLAQPQRFAGRRVGLVLSGGNIDSRLLASVIMRAMVRDGRIILLRVDLNDVPGSLAKVATMIGEAQANIIEIHHHRTFSDQSAKSTSIDVVAETRDPGHAQDVVALLKDAGYRVRLLSTEGDPAGQLD